MAEHSAHVLEKLSPAVSGIAGKEAREEQPYHANAKVVPESNPVALKDAIAVLPYHARLKLVPHVVAALPCVGEVCSPRQIQRGE